MSMTEDGSISAVGESWASVFTSSVDATPSTGTSDLPSTPGMERYLSPTRLVSPDNTYSNREEARY